jgi:CspA family cold shock protein
MGNTWRKDKDKGRDHGGREHFERRGPETILGNSRPTTAVTVEMPFGTYITGKVKYYNTEKGFGFIIRDDGKSDVFFHMSRLVGIENPAVGLKVKFVVEDSPKGPRASNIQISI